ncbi:sensor histidine kinase [Microbacterium capsulatum]|uniref:histidine kinase n=1 Tax=Microbacterium capsulatum TaxID=3041921 RepID=A0ABU0XIA0_9MICO|nr:sensor histidine kinase [Microbacterium sp. ASV81]MDQ4214862.1 sensor histidine kinase [Microbacterium sp. ASV81]
MTDQDLTSRPAPGSPTPGEHTGAADPAPALLRRTSASPRPADPPAVARLHSSTRRALSAALVMIAVFAFLLGAVELGAGTMTPDSLWVVALFTGVFWIWVAAGLLAWWRRPSNGTGLLIVVGGIALFLAGLGNLQVPALAILSAVFATSPLAMTVHLLHAFPSGRLRGRLSIVTVVLGWISCPVFQLALVLIPVSARTAFDIVATAQKTLGISVMILTAIVLARRLVAADPAHRRVLLPLFGYGIVAVLVLAFAHTVVQALGGDPAVGGVVQLLVSAAIPIAFLLGVLLGGFRRTGDLEPLSAWLGASGAGGTAVARALASTLGDDSLRVVYWSEEREEFVDADGVPIDPAERGPDRGWYEVHVGSRLVGAIVYDTRMTADPGPVRRAGDVLAIAVDRERLTTELLATNEALMQSRIRLVETADRERSRIAQDLHDGIQVQLVLLALGAQTIANAPDASPETSEASARLRQGIDQAAADLRRLVHNVLPVTLTERGLTAAAEDLVDRLSIPATLDTDVDDAAISATTAHTAYFIIAEALTNTVKHSKASWVRVALHADRGRLHIDVRDNGIGGADLRRGAGLHGLLDRVDALGGRLQVRSDPGHGTEVRVELPCA